MRESLFRDKMISFDLREFKDGSFEPAHDDTSEDTDDKVPANFDLDKFNEGRRFFQRNVSQCLAAMMCSLVCGLCVKNLLDVLVATGVTCTPLDSIRRYLSTTAHILRWHYGNVWDKTSSARKSIQAVRKMHFNARRLMISKNENSTVCDGEDTSTKEDQDLSVAHVNQYDMSLVQSGFIGLIIMYPRHFGIRCTHKDLDNYVYFWRCIGFLLGINDQNNICVGGYDRAYQICKAIEQDIVLPAFYERPPHFYPMAKAFTDGINLLLKVPFTSPEHMFALGLSACGEPLTFPMSWRDKLAVFISRTLAACHLYLPGFAWAMRKMHETIFRCHTMT